VVVEEYCDPIYPSSPKDKVQVAVSVDVGNENRVRPRRVDSINGVDKSAIREIEGVTCPIAKKVSSCNSEDI
jgi:hypothetical protein